MEERLQTLEEVLSFNDKNGIEGIASISNKANAPAIEEEFR